MHQTNVLPFTTIFSRRGRAAHECSTIQHRLLIHSEKTQHRRRLTLSLCGFLRKTSTGFSLRKWRTIKAADADAHAHGATRWIFMRPRFRFRIRFRRKKRQESKKGRHAQEEDVELCKKRILMGEKCRPFNPSGLLHYDEQGIFLPEDVVF